jgi:integrase
MPRKRTDWPPPKPHGFEFSPHRDGWSKWYKGQARVIAVKSLDRAAVRAAWDQRKGEIDAALGALAHKAPTAGGATYRECAAAYYEYLDHRVTTRLPKPLSPYTREDIKRTVNAVGRCCGPDRPAREYGPDDFTKFAKGIAGQAPSTLARHVAYENEFFAWCVLEGYVDRVPSFGAYFARPPQQEHRDARLAQAKSFKPAEIRAQWAAADHVERCWIALGLNGALDNADLANLPLPEPGGVLDLEAAVLDYRRRKRGKVRRVIPLLPVTVRLIRHYLKRHRRQPADPSHAELLFITRDGHPVGRLKDSSNPERAGRANAIDAVSRAWQRLMVKAGLRKPPTVTRTGKGANRKRSLKFAGDADRRGFRSFRTTVANSYPPGFKEEIEIVMGHVQDSVLIEHYLETLGLTRLRELVEHVWATAFTSPPPPGGAFAATAASPAAGAAGPVGRTRSPGEPRPPAPARPPSAKGRRRVRRP